MPLRTLIYSFILILLAGCQQDSGHDKSDLPPVLDAILEKNELVVVTRNAPTTYYNLRDEQTGFEFDMTQAFAESLGVKVRYIIKDSTRELLQALQSGEAHLGAAGLSKTPERQALFLFGPTYQEVQQQVVCRRGGPNPKKIDDLIGLEIKVPAETSYAERLTQLSADNREIAWQQDYATDTEILLENVWLKKIECTVADSHIVSINRRYYPELRVRFELAKPESLAWAMPQHATQLKSKIDEWFGDYRDSGQLEALLERYYGYIEVFDYVDTRKYVRRIHKVLPKYKKEFKKAATKNKIDWTLLAAQSYQESHWRRNARSPTGVRGMMMLTQTTAKEVGITSRLDPKQSIQGGAKYMQRLIQRIPEDVTGHDRILFALAAYNVGMGHVHDARTLARRLKKNPDVWHEVSEVLPLLSQKKYYKTLKYGYARGREPVRYVQRIRDYHNILLKHLEKI